MAHQRTEQVKQLCLREAELLITSLDDPLLEGLEVFSVELSDDMSRVRIVCVANPRRLYRPQEVSWNTVAEPDDGFMSDTEFNTLFDGDTLIAVSGGSTAALEPVIIRSRAPARNVIGWQRGETTASPAEIMAFNGITAERLAERARAITPW